MQQLMADNFKAKQSSDPLINMTLDGAYRIKRALAYQFVANMYLAIDLTTNREVTIKIPNEPYASDENYLHRLEIDVNALQVINHTSIVQVLNFRSAVESDRKLTYVVMEYIKGKNLRDYFEETQNRNTIEDLFEMLDQVAEAIDYVHERKILHRDLRLQKIIIRTFDKIPKIVDFDFAHPHDKMYKAANEFSDIDAISYAAPETCRGLELDSRADIYSFAMCIYLTVGKSLCFDASNPKDFYRMQIQENPVPIRERNRAWPKEFEDVLMTAFSKDPNERPKNCRDFVASLELTMRKRKDRPLVRYFSRAVAYQNTPLPISTVEEEDVSGSAHSIETIRAEPIERSIPRRQPLNTPAPMPKPEKIQKVRGYTPLTFIAILALFLLLMPIISGIVAPRFTSSLLSQLGFDMESGFFSAFIQVEQEPIIMSVDSTIQAKQIAASKVEYLTGEDDNIILPPKTQKLTWEVSPVLDDLHLNLNPTPEWITVSINGNLVTYNTTQESTRVNIAEYASDEKASVSLQFIGNASSEYRSTRVTLRSKSDGFLWQKSFQQEPAFSLSVLKDGIKQSNTIIPIELPRVATESVSFEIQANSYQERPLRFASMTYNRDSIWFPYWIEAEHDFSFSDKKILTDRITIKATKEILNSCKPQNEIVELGPGLPRLQFILPEVEPRFDLELAGVQNGNNYRWAEDVTSRGKILEVASAEIIGCPDIEPPLPEVNSFGYGDDWYQLSWQKSDQVNIRQLVLELSRNEVSLEREMTLVFEDETFTDSRQTLAIKQRPRPCWPEFYWATNKKPFLRDISSRAQTHLIEILDLDCAGVDVGDSITISPQSHPDFLEQDLSSLLIPKQEGIQVALTENRNAVDRRLEVLYRGSPIVNLIQEAYRPPTTPTPEPTPTPKPQRKPTEFDSFWLTHRSKPLFLSSELQYYSDQISGMQFQTGVTVEEELQIALSLWLISWQANQITSTNPMSVFEERTKNNLSVRNKFQQVEDYFDFINSPQLPPHHSSFRMNSRPYQIYENGKLVKQASNTEPRIISLEHVDFSSHEISIWMELEWYESNPNGLTKRRREQGVLAIPHPNTLRHESRRYQESPANVLSFIKRLEFTSVPNAPSKENIKRLCRVDTNRYMLLSSDEIRFLDLRDGKSEIRSTNSGVPVNYLFDDMKSLGTSQYLFSAKHKNRNETKLGILLYDRLSQSWRYQYDTTINDHIDVIYPMPKTNNLIYSKESINPETQVVAYDFAGIGNFFDTTPFGTSFSSDPARVKNVLPDRKPTNKPAISGRITSITSDIKDSIYFLNSNNQLFVNSLTENNENISKGKTGLVPDRQNVEQVAQDVEFIAGEFESDPLGNLIIANRFKLNLYWQPEPAYFHELDELVNTPEY